MTNNLSVETIRDGGIFTVQQIIDWYWVLLDEETVEQAKQHVRDELWIYFAKNVPHSTKVSICYEEKFNKCPSAQRGLFVAKITLYPKEE